MEGNPLKNNPKGFPVLKPEAVRQAAQGVRKSLTKDIVSQTEITPKKAAPQEIPKDRKTNQGLVGEAAKDFYEIRTMQQDFDRAKGKKVSSVSLTKEKLFQIDKRQPKMEELHLGRRQKLTDMTQEKFLREGIIGEAGKQEESSPKSLLARLRRLFLRRRAETQKTGRKKFVLILGLIIVIFIGGAGYYFYTSGALSSIEGIGEIFQDWFGQRSDKPPVVPLSTTTPPVVPPATSTPLLDDSKIAISPAFFEPDEKEIIKLAKLDNFYSELKASFEKELGENKFRRIGVVGLNDFSNLSLAQVWKSLKALALGDKYSELISGEVIENWGLAMPGNVYKKISENYNIFFYSQPDNGLRAVLIFKMDNIAALINDMALWETTMLYDLKNLFLGVRHGEAATETFEDNIYKDIHIRYLNLPKPNLTLDYLIMPAHKYLILTTSREAAWATIDRILGTGPVAVDNEEDEFAGWKSYTNEEYAFEVKYPSNWEVFIITDDNTGATFYNPEYPLLYPDVTEAPDSRPGVICVGYVEEVSIDEDPREAISYLMNQQGEKIVVGNIYAGEIRESPGSKLVLFNINNIIYEIVLFNYHKLSSDQERQKVENIFRSMIRSFKISED